MVISVASKMTGVLLGSMGKTEDWKKQVGDLQQGPAAGRIEGGDTIYTPALQFREEPMNIHID